MNNFPKLAMAKFSNQASEKFNNQDLVSMHNTNPEPFSQSELEQTIGRPFHSILQNVNLGFAPDVGTVALRQTLVNYHYETIAVDDVVTHAGAQEALFCVFNALLKTGDKVLVVAPIFEPLVQIPINIGCDVSYVYLQESNHWSLNLDEVEENFKSGCRLFVINFPHNPTGATLTEGDLLKVVALCKQYDVWLLSDEVFRGMEHSLDSRLPAVADIYDKGISVGGISKAFAIPGIRIGWLVGKKKQLLEKILDIKGYISICNSQIDELLASVILQKHEQLTQRNLAIILPNKLLLKDLNLILEHKVEILVPDAGCCVFAQIKTNICVENLLKNIAEHKHYLLYPSSLFKTEVKALRIGFGNHQFNDFCEKIKGS